MKHFNWTPRGPRRLHAKPKAGHIDACRPWLEAEIATLRPQVVVCLGAVAAQALLGKAFRVTRQRGELFENTGWAPLVTATIHPSAILRAPDEAARREAYRGFVKDLRTAAERVNAT